MTEESFDPPSTIILSTTQAPQARPCHNSSCSLRQLSWKRLANKQTPTHQQQQRLLWRCNVLPRNCWGWQRLLGGAHGLLKSCGQCVSKWQKQRIRSGALLLL